MPVRVGFVGCGGMAGGHIENWARMREQGEDVALTAFCDVDAARAERYAARFEGRAYTDFREMLEREALEAVYVVVPPHAHTGAEILAAQKGCALFVEKPIANSLATAREIAAAIEKAGVLSSVGYHMRYQESTDRAAEALQGKTIGMVMGYWMGGMPGVPWWRRLEQSGGQFVEQTTHIVDLARYLVGDVTEVYANATVRALKDVENFTVTDVGAANLKFESGAIGTIHNTCLLKMGYTTGLNVLTPELIVEITGSSCKLIEPGKRTEYTTRDSPYQREDRIFLDAIQSGDRSAIRSTYADALKSLAVTLAVNESYQTGEPIKVRV
jgi:myo-inositol 2-dehydrogenase / D-chiro-inositol 1-dehydrogenase